MGISHVHGRETCNLNAEWRYQRGDYDSARQVSFDDSAWEHVGLPHSFSIPYFMSKDFYVGYGWYRKHLQLKKQDLGKRLSLEFDGVFQEAQVFVNGSLAGRHTGGYTGFSIDITQLVKAGDNVLAVRVNNLWQPQVAPRGGEHVFSGGIYRNVRLVKTDLVYLPWCGTRITTPSLAAADGKSSNVAVSSRIANAQSHPVNVRLSVEVMDDKGKVAVTADSKSSIDAKSEVELSVTTPELCNPNLWSPESPYLYTVNAKVYCDGKVVDTMRYPLGFRWFEWSADKGFCLNGERYVLRGANVHQDQAGWGDAVTDAAAQRDVKMMKEAGFNMIRGSHYPHSPAFVEACDREGILLWSEAPFWGTAGPKDDGWWTASAYPVNPADTAAFEASALAQLEEMILIHRNNPSVFVWSMCNEPFFTDGRTLPGVHRLLRRMVEHSHLLDPTRKAAIGGAQRPLGEMRIDLIGDVAGYNGDGANIPDFQSPSVPSLVSEYGSTTADRPGKFTPGWGDLNRDEGWKGRPWRAGQAIWCGYDHGSIFGADLGKMGIVDYFRLPKRSWYWYRQEYNGIPAPEWPTEGKAAALKLSASSTNGISADGTDDVQLTVTVLDSEGRHISNSPTTSLAVISGPGEFPTGKSISFAPDSDIRIMDGEAAIAFRSYYSGTAVIVASSAGLKPDTLTLSFTGAPQYVAGVSPETKARPYTRYERVAQDMLISFGHDNPTFASSSADGHSAGFATDGQTNTYWLPQKNDTERYWTLDTERGVMMHALKVRFANDTVLPVNIEISNDNTTWQEIFSGSKEQSLFEVSLSEPRKMRFVRLSFPRGTDGVSEVEVIGAYSNQ